MPLLIHFMRLQLVLLFLWWTYIDDLRKFQFVYAHASFQVRYEKIIFNDPKQ